MTRVSRRFARDARFEIYLGLSALARAWSGVSSPAGEPSPLPGSVPSPPRVSHCRIGSFRPVSYRRHAQRHPHRAAAGRQTSTDHVQRWTLAEAATSPSVRTRAGVCVARSACGRLKDADPWSKLDSQFPIDDTHVVFGLQVQPEPRLHAEEDSEPKRGVRRDGPLAIHQLADAAWRNVDVRRL